MACEDISNNILYPHIDTQQYMGDYTINGTPVTITDNLQKRKYTLLQDVSKHIPKQFAGFIQLNIMDLMHMYVMNTLNDIIDRSNDVNIFKTFIQKYKQFQYKKLLDYDGVFAELSLLTPSTTKTLSTLYGGIFERIRAHRDKYISLFNTALSGSTDTNINPTDLTVINTISEPYEGFRKFTENVFGTESPEIKKQILNRITATDDKILSLYKAYDTLYKDVLALYLYDFVRCCILVKHIDLVASITKRDKSKLSQRLNDTISKIVVAARDWYRLIYTINSIAKCDKDTLNRYTISIGALPVLLDENNIERFIEYLDKQYISYFNTRLQLVSDGSGIKTKLNNAAIEYKDLFYIVEAIASYYSSYYSSSNKRSASTSRVIDCSNIFQQGNHDGLNQLLNCKQKNNKVGFNSHDLHRLLSTSLAGSGTSFEKRKELLKTLVDLCTPPNKVTVFNYINTQTDLQELNQYLNIKEPINYTINEGGILDKFFTSSHEREKVFEKIPAKSCTDQGLHIYQARLIMRQLMHILSLYEVRYKEIANDVDQQKNIKTIVDESQLISNNISQEKTRKRVDIIYSLIKLHLLKQIVQKGSFNTFNDVLIGKYPISTNQFIETLRMIQKDMTESKHEFQRIYDSLEELISIKPDVKNMDTQYRLDTVYSWFTKCKNRKNEQCVFSV